MIIVDTSALAAILFREEEGERYTEAVLMSGGAIMSAANLIEMHVVAAHRGIADHARKLDLIVAELGIRIEPFGADQLRAARGAFDAYGRGRHPAALNFGDCFAYGLARTLDYPLLFKGEDFSKTDVRPALG